MLGPDQIRSDQFNSIITLLTNTINQTSFEKKYSDFNGAANIFKWLSPKLNHQKNVFSVFFQLVYVYPMEKTLATNSKLIFKIFTTPYWLCLSGSYKKPPL